MELHLQSGFVNLWLVVRAVFTVTCYASLILFVAGVGIRELWRKP